MPRLLFPSREKRSCHVMIDMYVRDDKGEKVKTSEESGYQQKIIDNSGIYQPENTRYESKNILFHIKRCSDPTIH